jgi:hypothetical protein
MTTMLDLTTCPECGAAAHVEWRAVLESTDGPIEHAKVRCEQRHWFLLPVADLPRARAASDPWRSSIDVRT